MNDQRFDALIDLAADDLASADELHELNALTKTDPIRAKKLLSALDLEVLLRSSHEHDLSAAINDLLAQERIRRNVIAKIQRPSARWSRKRQVNKRTIGQGTRRTLPQLFFSSGKAAALIAALIVAFVSGVVTIQYYQNVSQPTDEQSSMVNSALGDNKPGHIPVTITGKIVVNDKSYSDGKYFLPVGSDIRGSSGQLILSDGSIITCEQAHLTLPSTAEQQHFSLIAGKIFCQVKTRTNQDNLFTIQTTDGLITVVGTSFSVYKTETTQVLVENGSVSASSGSQKLVLQAGESAELSLHQVRRREPSLASSVVTRKDITLRMIDGKNSAIQYQIPALQVGSTIDIANFPEGFNILIEAPPHVAGVHPRLDRTITYLINEFDDKGDQRENKRPFSLWGDQGSHGPFHKVLPPPGPLNIRIEFYADSRLEQSLGLLEWPITIIDSRKP